MVTLQYHAKLSKIWNEHKHNTWGSILDTLTFLQHDKDEKEVHIMIWLVIKTI
jgi:hypothetical protein